jgi:hypothetical protein
VREITYIISLFFELSVVTPEGPFPHRIRLGFCSRELFEITFDTSTASIKLRILWCS